RSMCVPPSVRSSPRPAVKNFGNDGNAAGAMPRTRIDDAERIVREQRGRRLSKWTRDGGNHAEARGPGAARGVRERGAGLRLVVSQLAPGRDSRYDGAMVVPRDTQHRSILQRIATRAMIERGLEPEFPAPALEQLETIHAPAAPDGSSTRDLRNM